jgi:hypothetical protein
VVWYVWLSVCMMFLLNARNMFVCTKTIMNKRNTTNEHSFISKIRDEDLLHYLP